jgi:sugar phosphate isomerase/epimerase
MRLSVQERLLPGATLTEQWDAARRAGFDGIELLGQGDHRLRQRLPGLVAARNRGVVFSSVCVNMDHFIGDFDAARRADAVANVASQLEVAAELGGMGVVTPAAWGLFTRKLPPFDPPPRDADGDREVLVDGLRQLGEHAAAHGVAVLFEPLNRYEDHMINTLEQGAAWCDAVGIDSVRLLADTYHMNIEEDDPPAALRAAGPLIGHVHVGDNARWQPGTGHIDFAAVVDALVDIGYDGWLAMECNLRGDQEAALALATATLRPLIEAAGR